MNETILPGDYNLADAVVGNNNYPAPRSTWQRIIRKPLTWVIVGLVIVGTAVAIMVAGKPGPVTPSSILKSDGYTVSLALNHQQVIAAMDSAGGSSDNAVANSMFTDAAMGTQGGNDEVVIGLTDQGKALAQLAIAGLGSGSGVQAHVADGGRYLVIDGAAGDMGNFGTLNGNTGS